MQDNTSSQGLNLYQEPLVEITNSVLCFDLKMLQALHRAAWQVGSCSPKTHPAWVHRKDECYHEVRALSLKETIWKIWYNTQTIFSLGAKPDAWQHQKNICFLAYFISHEDFNTVLPTLSFNTQFATLPHELNPIFLSTWPLSSQGWGWGGLKTKTDNSSTFTTSFLLGRSVVACEDLQPTRGALLFRL